MRYEMMARCRPARFDLVKEDEGGDLINDDCDKYDDDGCDDCGDNTSCNVTSMLMVIVMIVVIIPPAMFQ